MNDHSYPPTLPGPSKATDPSPEPLPEYINIFQHNKSLPTIRAAELLTLRGSASKMMNTYSVFQETTRGGGHETFR
jgi:hypothetical protein